MMTEHKIAAGHKVHDSISFAVLPDDIVVIRITGRGTFQNSIELRKLGDTMSNRDGVHPQFIIDLEECVTMDSTFMGVLASLGLRQLRTTDRKLVIVNANPQNIRLLETLGLSQFIAVRASPAGTPPVTDEDFKCLLREKVSRTDRIIHMIEAHKDLCEADPSNNLRFESVLKYLRDSLEHEEK